MNDERTPEAGEFESLEQQLKSLRPAEIPAFVQARMQFELGRRQGRREARKAMLVYASAACLTVWAGTTWMERSNSNDPTSTIVQSANFSPEPKLRETPPLPAWTLDDVRKLARYEAAALGDTQFGDSVGIRDSAPSKADDKKPEMPEGPWNRQRWLKELMAESAPVSS